MLLLVTTGETPRLRYFKTQKPEPLMMVNEYAERKRDARFKEYVEKYLVELGFDLTKPIACTESADRWFTYTQPEHP